MQQILRHRNMINYIKNLRIVYFMTLISPILIIGIYILTLDKGTVMMNDSIDAIFRYLIPIFGLIFIPIGFIFFKKRLKGINKEERVDTKLNLYRGIVVQRIAFIEGIAIFSAIAFIITLNYLFVIYTLIALVIYLPIYPTIGKINNDLGISQDSFTIDNSENKKKNFWNKNPWLIILLIVVMIFLNYNYFKEFISNKVVLPSIEVDNGTIQDSIYHNNYLKWTFKIPDGYKLIPISEIKDSEQKGNKYFNNEIDNSDKPIRLLNISNGLIDFGSNLNPRVLFPNLTSEDRYLETIDNKLKNANIDSIKFEKQNQGALLIDSLEFKFSEYFIIGPNGRIGLMCITRFNKDYIFDISLTYKDSEEAVKFLNRLKTSELNWQ